jgi:pSer/pThr/pTyr-binding forkhead associated (FHA) protein
MRKKVEKMQPQMKLMISVIEKRGERRERTFSNFPISIGRLPDNDIVIIDDFVSRKHCKIFTDGESIVVEDLNSTNGSILNNESVVEATSLSDKDVLQVGKFQLVLNIL